MIEYKSGDLLNVKKGIIVHGCNAQGVMGSGVAKAIRAKYPEVYDRYCVDLEHFKETSDPMGQLSFYRASLDIIIVSAITQETYGRTGDKFVSYDAIDKAFKFIRNLVGDNSALPVHIPKIGAGLGGGDWNIIEAIINANMKEVPVICWEL